MFTEKKNVAKIVYRPLLRSGDRPMHDNETFTE